MARKPISFVCFATLWLFIALVSAYDTARCVQDAHVLMDVELNPLARFILRRGGASHLVGFKFLGTSLVLGIFCWMWERTVGRWTRTCGPFGGGRGVRCC